jgi:CBS domain-containing protein
MKLEEKLSEKVSGYVSDFVSVQSGTSISEAAKVMAEKNVTEILVMKGEEPIGIITERDFLFRVLASGVLPSTPVDRIMSAPIETIDENSTVEEAISKMVKLGIRRLAVVRNGKIVGIITQKAILSGRAGKIPLPELHKPGVLICPYCGSQMESNEVLSKHIDQVHIGKGLLQGNVTKW